MHLLGLPRRRFLQTLASVAAVSPLASMLGRSVAHAEDGAVGCRLLVLYTPHGTSFSHWRPQTAEGGGFDISYPEAILAPLAPLQEKICVIEGLDMLSAYKPGASGHEGGMASMLTGGSHVVDGALDTATHVSLDQVIADHLQSSGSRYPNRALNFFVGPLDATFGGGTSAFFENTGSEIRPVPCEVNPRAVFDRLFEGITPDGPTPEQLALVARKQSIIDTSRVQVEALRSRVGVAERAKMDAHLQAIAELGARLDAGGLACAPPRSVTGELGKVDLSSENYPQRIAEFSDIVTQALACRLSGVVGLQLLFSSDYSSLPHLDINYDTHNELAHGAIVNGAVVGSDPYRTDFLKMQTWFTSVVADLLTKLDGVVEENGRTLLDNTMVCWVNDMGDPSLHSNVDMPVVLAGGIDQIEMGRYLQYDFSSGDHSNHLDGSGSAPHNQLYTSICRAFGMDIDTFGDPSYSGELPGLLS